MSIRAEKSYKTVNNNILRSDVLSFKAKGLLICMLSLPDDFKFSEKSLGYALKPEGLFSIRSGLKELEAAGYLQRRRLHDDRGRLTETEWIVREIPITEGKAE